MKIPNPWPRCVVQLTDPEGDVIGVQSGRTLEVDAAEVLLQPCKSAGRGGKVSVLAQGMIWSKDFGLTDISDHKKKRDLAAQEESLRKDIEKAAAKKAKEARERGAIDEKIIKAVKEAPAKVVDEKMSMGKHLKL